MKTSISAPEAQFLQEVIDAVRTSPRDGLAVGGTIIKGYVCALGERYIQHYLNGVMPSVTGLLSTYVYDANIDQLSRSAQMYYGAYRPNLSVDADPNWQITKRIFMLNDYCYLTDLTGEYNTIPAMQQRKIYMLTHLPELMLQDADPYRP